MLEKLPKVKKKAKQKRKESAGCRMCKDTHEIGGEPSWNGYTKLYYFRAVLFA